VTDIRSVVVIETTVPLTVGDAAACLTDLSVLLDAAFSVVYGSRIEEAPDSALEVVRTGSLIVELLTTAGDERVVAALGVFGSLVTSAPWLAGLPHKIREHWYKHALLAEEARIAYEDLRAYGRVEVRQEEVASRDRRPQPRRHPNRTRLRQR
jgi:hypothetical protein